MICTRGRTGRVQGSCGQEAVLIFYRKIGLIHLFLNASRNSFMNDTYRKTVSLYCVEERKINF